MRVRALDANFDYTFGQGSQNYLANSSAAVAQCVLTALRLFQGEWFLDTSAGVPWLTQVIGINTLATYDVVIKNAISNVVGVAEILSYSSVLNGTTLTVTATVATVFSTTVTVSGVTLSLPGGWGSGGYGAVYGG